MFERPHGGHSAVLVHIEFPQEHTREDLTEFRELAVSAGATILEVVTGTRVAPDAKYFVGTGKAEEIKQTVQAVGAELVIVNHSLSPAQERNLERLLECRVLDRIGLILDIFAQRARTFEGKLQVELAQLSHVATRLVRGWTHLERQKGGIGLRGPGETQLETDRRLIRHRIKTINERLEKVRQQRDQNRRARQRVELPTISLVGYTNAGKSTLFNQLTEADVYAANQLFATLDPTLRRMTLPEVGPVVFADTVGFIRHLPHELVESFRATLEELQTSTLLLHVIDASHPQRHLHIEQVEKVLEQVGANAVRQIQIFNKIDLLDDTPPRIERNDEGVITRIFISAKTSAGLDMLLRAIIEQLFTDMVYRQLCLSAREGRLRSNLYALGAVVEEVIDDGGNSLLTVNMKQTDFARLFGEFEHR